MVFGLLSNEREFTNIAIGDGSEWERRGFDIHCNPAHGPKFGNFLHAFNTNHKRKGGYGYALPDLAMTHEFTATCAEAPGMLVAGKKSRWSIVDIEVYAVSD
jgi:hypothetical protein